MELRKLTNNIILCGMGIDKGSLIIIEYVQDAYITANVLLISKELNSLQLTIDSVYKEKELKYIIKNSI